jgi:hypothetical protein
LARLASTTNEAKPEISKHELAPIFLEYYWPLEVRYHLRQGIDPDKDPIVMKRIRDFMEEGDISHGESLRDFQRRMPEKHKMLVAQIAREAFDESFHVSIKCAENELSQRYTPTPEKKDALEN